MRPSPIWLCILLALPAAAQETPPPTHYQPASRAFACDLPPGWTAFEESEPWGFAVHVVGPDDAAGDFRAGIDIHYFEKGQPGFVPAKEYVDELRRGEKASGREATPLRVMRIGNGLGRLFEVSENRRLPFDGLPAQDQALHHYYAVIALGENYYTIDLSSSRESYLDYRETFTDFLRSFKADAGG